MIDATILTDAAVLTAVVVGILWWPQAGATALTALLLLEGYRDLKIYIFPLFSSPHLSLFSRSGD